MLRTRLSILAAALALPLSIAVASAAFATQLLRFPDVHGDKVVFCYGGDLWIAPVAGGTAIRLTAHPGLELFPKFSPDGQWIAFTGQYDGDEQVYVIPAAGGVPKQLTWYPAQGPLPPRWGSDNQVYGWTKDGKAVLFRSSALPIPISKGATSRSRSGRRSPSWALNSSSTGRLAATGSPAFSRGRTTRSATARR
ncbi:MAG TPA: hypothetical protein VFE33_27660 [Thermoanaerobaculia bacterium]|nr:hypothetical protein [Thermoanaerobaculia bacterium]